MEAFSLSADAKFRKKKRFSATPRRKALADSTPGAREGHRALQLPSATAPGREPMRLQASSVRRIACASLLLLPPTFGEFLQARRAECATVVTR